MQEDGHQGDYRLSATTKGQRSHSQKPHAHVYAHLYTHISKIPILSIL